jgi:hypothetical protein
MIKKLSAKIQEKMRKNKKIEGKGKRGNSFVLRFLSGKKRG